MTVKDLVTIVIHRDDDVAGHIKARRGYIESLAIQNGLESFFEDSLCFYTCVDGPVLVIWGIVQQRTKIVGMTLDVDALNPDSAFLLAWQQFRSSKLTRKDVHVAILRATDQVLN